MKVIKKLFKIIIIALAVFMGVSACVFNKNNNTAFADEEVSNYNNYYFEINAGTVFVAENPTISGTISSGWRYGGAIVFDIANGDGYARYYVPTVLGINVSNQVNTTQLTLFFSLDTLTSLTLTNTVKIPITNELVEMLGSTSIYIINTYLFASNTLLNYSVEEIENKTIYLSNDNQYENGYQNGYGNGYGNGAEEENLKNSVGVLYNTNNIKLNFYANDVAGVVATVDNATVHYTQGGLSFAPYSEEYESVITGYQPEYPENFIERCEVIINTELFIVEDINNTIYQYAIENLILNYPTTFYGDDVIGYVRQPTVELQFGFGTEFGGTDWIPFTVEKLRGTSQDYLTLNKEELRPYYDYAQGYLTGIKITYYDRDIFSFYEPNALLTVDKFNGVVEYVDGLNTGYGNGYITGEQIGYENGFQDAVNGGYDNQGIFAGAVAFLRLFFELIGGFMERKIVGEITFGLIIIGIPATLMIVDLIISLIRKFLGKSGGTE